MQEDTAYRENDIPRQLLREKILANGIEGGWGSRRHHRRALQKAFVVEASEPTSYYFHTVSKENDLHPSIFPNLSYPLGVGEVSLNSPMFFEAGMPTAHYKTSTGEPPRVGFLMAWKRLPGHLVSERLPRQRDYVGIKIRVFRERGPEDNSPVASSGIPWGVALHGDREVVMLKDCSRWRIPLFGARKQGKFSQMKRRDGERLPAPLIEAANKEAGLLNAGLFALCCFNASAGGSSSRCDPWTQRHADPCTCRDYLSHVETTRTRDTANYKLLGIGRLAQKLEQKGGASELGLGHALTVCREEFR